MQISLPTLNFLLLSTSAFYLTVSANKVDGACAASLHSTQTLVNDARTTMTEFMNSKQNQNTKTRLAGAIKTYGTADVGFLALVDADDITVGQKTAWIKTSKDLLAAGKMVTGVVKPDGPEASDLVEDLSIAEMGVGDVNRKCAAQLA